MSLIIVKSDNPDAPEQHIVMGEVYAPTPDSVGDYMSREDIQKAAHKFMKDLRLDQVDSQHDNRLVKGAHIVESFIARKGDPNFIEGAWVVAMHIDNPDMWAKIKKGEINGFSLEAMATTTKGEVEVEIPPVISGDTSTNSITKDAAPVESHSHQFFVTYDMDGNFLGGSTSRVQGHSHVIKGGTITETSNGHTHRFSAVDNLFIS